MKEITLEQFSPAIGEILDAAQSQQILITRDGKPLAVVIGVQNKDEEDFRLEASPEFWRMIEERRRQPTIPLEGAKAELFGEEIE